MNNNNYKIIEEKKYYAVFKDGEGKTQTVEISTEVANALRIEQKYENAVVRANERHTISLESLDYEGKAFACYDDYDVEDDKKEISNKEKVHYAIKQMKPKQAKIKNK